MTILVRTQQHTPWLGSHGSFQLGAVYWNLRLHCPYLSGKFKREKKKSLSWIWYILVSSSTKEQDKLNKKWEYCGMVHKLFIDFKKTYDSVTREVLYNILAESGVPTKLVRSVKMCLIPTVNSRQVNVWDISYYERSETWRCFVPTTLQLFL
jgi:hypothetical protein